MNYFVSFILAFSFLFLNQGLPLAQMNSFKDPKIFFTEPFSLEGQKDGIPLGWKLKRWTGRYHVSILREENGNDVLQMKSEGNSFGLYKKIQVNLKKFPILTWRWKVDQLPIGGDVRSKKTDDQAAQVYVVFPRFPAIVNSRMVGYIWENLTPKGLEVQSQKSSNTRYIVLQSGPTLMGTWQTQRQNVYEDYIRLFGDEPSEVGGITLMIDSDDTQSSAESFFDHVQFKAP